MKKTIIEAVWCMAAGTLMALSLLAWNPAPAADGIEYIFIGVDGVKRYEIVMNNSDVWRFKSMHKANIAMPLSHYVQLAGE